MWPLLRAELTYTRGFLVAAWAVAAGVALFITPWSSSVARSSPS